VAKVTTEAQIDHIHPLHQFTDECKRIAEAANWQLHPKLYIRGYGKVRDGSDDEDEEPQQIF
jgi:hypothetical protein